MSRRRVRLPIAGLAVGMGVFVVECLFVLGTMLSDVRASGVGGQMLAAVLVYSSIGAAADLLFQRLAPAAFASTSLAGGAAAALLLTGLASAAGQYACLPLVLGGVVWALLLFNRWARVVAVGALVLSTGNAFPREHPESTRLADHSAEGPSFVIVVLDTLRWDHTSAYGYHRDTTPNLAALARRGLRFERAYSTACWSLPSHASLLTGRYAAIHGAHYEHLDLDGPITTLTEELVRLGYETAGFSANPLVSPGNGMARGFTRFDEVWRGPFVRSQFLFDHLFTFYFGSNKDKGGAEIVSSVRTWLDQRDSSRPYFLFINLMEAHAPYQRVPERHRTAYTDPGLTRRRAEMLGDRVNYAQQLGYRIPRDELDDLIDLLDGATAAADAYLGEILDAVGADAVVVVVSDHGDLLGEHDMHGHRRMLYEPLIRIPFVMAGPGVPVGATLAPAVSLVDVMPTLLAFTNAAPVASDGIDLLAARRDAAPMSDRTVMAEHMRPLGEVFGRTDSEASAMQSRRWAVVSATTKRVVAEDGSDEGFDLTNDADELSPFPGALTGLTRLTPEVSNGDPAREPFDDLERRALRELGYAH